MIGKVVLTRIEPCFMASKKVCGEVSRVKKETNNQSSQQVQYPVQWEKDTFTSSASKSENKTDEKKSNIKQQSSDKFTRQGN